MEHFWENIDGWSCWRDQGVLLDILLREIEYDDILKIAEIGVYKGRMTAMWVVELINRGIVFEYYGIDHFMGSLNHEKGIDYFKIVMENLDRVIHYKSMKDIAWPGLIIVKNESTIEAALHDDGYFDIVYIDGEHDYESVRNDIAAWWPKVKIKGVICGDDYTPGWDGVVRAVNEFAGNVNVVGNQQWWRKKG